MVAVEGVHQAVLDHRVDELGVAHLGAGAQVGGVGRERHALAAARDDDVGVAVGDLLLPIATARRPEPQSWLRPQAVFSCGMPLFIAA